MSVDQFEEAKEDLKEANQKWKYSNGEQAKVGGKLKLRLGDQDCKRSSRELRKAL